MCVELISEQMKGIIIRVATNCGNGDLLLHSSPRKALPRSEGIYILRCYF